MSDFIKELERRLEDGSKDLLQKPMIIGYINEQAARILASGMTVCTHISHVKTEYAQVALSAEVKS